MKTEVLIIGGGIPGLTLAGLLGAQGLKCCVVDPQPPEKLKDVQITGRTSALMHASVNILKAAGVWDKIADQTEALKVLRIIDDSLRGRPSVQTDFDSAEIGLEAFGYNTPNNVLRAALYEQVSKIKNVKLISPARLSDYTVRNQNVIARLEDGTEVTASVIIGADGRKSVTRAVAGIEANERPYGQKAITCLISHSKSHLNISAEFHRPGGPFTLVPLPGNMSSVVWVEKEEDADYFMRLSKGAFEKALQDRTNGKLGEIKLDSSPESWPLISLKAGSLTAERVALAAEAAHVLSPIGAQGLNLSLRDIAVLAETLIDSARLGQDLGSTQVLRKYETQRRPDILSRIYGVDGLNRMVANDTGLLKRLRRAGLKSLEASGPVRTIAMHQGLAPSLEDSRLMQGMPL